MSSDKDTNKVIVLVVVGVILALLAFIFAYWLLFSEPETKGPIQDTAFPESPMEPGTTPLDEDDEGIQVPAEFPTDTATDTPEAAETIQEPVSDWRDDVVEYNSYAPLAGQSDSPQSAPNAPETFDTSVYYYEPYIPTTRPGPATIPMITNTATDAADVMPPGQTLVKDNFKNCGSISVPASELSLNSFISGLDNDSSAICLGKAIANNCDEARVRLTGSASGYIYVAERNDGVCSAGTTIAGTNLVNLCSVEKIMNEATNQSLTVAEWQDEFDDDPGQTFVDAFQSGITDPTITVNWTASDCQMYDI